MDFNPEKIQAFLDMLVETGVEEFEGFGMHVRFTAGLFRPANEVDEDAVTKAAEKAVEQMSLWHDSTLWPGGKPPSFPGADD